jgi:hypothetical protein
MKTIFLILATGIVFSLSSCNSDTETDEKPDTTSTYANSSETNSPENGENPSPKEPDLEEPGYPDGEQEILPPLDLPNLTLDITVDDIKSFNTTTGEIVFTDLIIEKLVTSYKTEEVIYDRLSLYYNDKLLFEGIQIVSPVMSYAVNDLVFICYLNGAEDSPGASGYEIYGGMLVEPEYYLVDGYPIIEEGETWNYHGAEGVLDQDGVQRLRDENFKKRKAEWDIFIKYLRDAGKIVE